MRFFPLLSSLLLLLSLLPPPSSSSVTPEHVLYVDDADIPAYETFNAAVEREGEGDWEGARRLYERSLEMKGDLHEALLNLGCLHERRGGVESALESALGSSAAAAGSSPLPAASLSEHHRDLAHGYFHHLLSLSPPPSLKAGAHNNLGHLLRNRAGLDPLTLPLSVRHYRLALEYDGDHVDSLYNLAKARQEQGGEGNKEARELLERVLVLEPGHSEARLNLANCFFEGKESERALSHYEVIIENYASSSSGSSRPSSLTMEMVLNNRGNLFRESGFHDRALLSFRSAYAVSGDTSGTGLANTLVASRTLTDWSSYDDLTSSVLLLSSRRASHTDLLPHSLERPSLESRAAPTPLLPYDSLLLASTSPSLRLLIARDASRPYVGTDGVTVPPSSTPTTHMTVAYLSYDFRDHPMGHLTRGLVTGHDRERFKTVAVSYGKDDGSKHRRSFEQLDGAFIDAKDMSPLKAATELAQHSPDILIDLMSHTTGGRAQIAALRPARILVNYLGYPSTSGSPHFDYALVDRVVAPPEAEGHWEEKLVYLPGTYQVNEYDFEIEMCEGGEVCGRGRVALRGSDGEEPTGATTGRGATTPRPEIDTDVHTVAICNFNTIDKYDPTSFTSWTNLLLRNPGATLYLLLPKPPLGLHVQRNLHLEAMARGVDPGRIVMVGRVEHGEHVRRMGGCDLFVDHFTYTGHTTTSDFLWSGTPAFTVGGYGADGDGVGGMAARVSRSFLEDVFADEEEDYARVMVTDTVKVRERGTFDFVLRAFRYRTPPL